MIDPLSDEVLQQAAALYKKHGSKRAAAKAAGVPRSTFNSRLKQAAKRRLLGTDPVPPGFEIKHIASNINGDGKKKQEWVKQVVESGPKFVAPNGFRAKRFTVLSDQDEGTRLVWTRYGQEIDTQSVIDICKRAFKTYKPAAKAYAPPKRVYSDLLAVYPIADQHHGLLSWGAETGENYDLRIGVDRLRDCSARLIAKTEAAKTAIILNLGDWAHADDQRNVTPRSGHQLDVDGRYMKVLDAGVLVFVDVIERAKRKHQKIIVRNVPGNHDPHVARVLTIALRAWYRNDPRVFIDPDPGEFFYHRFGKVLIGATHGHRMKPVTMAQTMAVTQAQAWGETFFRYFYFGHIHHDTLASGKEVMRVKVESFRTIAAKDANAVAAGYNSGQTLVSIIHHRQTGEDARQYIQVRPPAVR